MKPISVLIAQNLVREIEVAKKITKELLKLKKFKTLVVVKTYYTRNFIRYVNIATNFGGGNKILGINTYGFNTYKLCLT